MALGVFIANFGFDQYIMSDLSAETLLVGSSLAFGKKMRVNRKVQKQPPDVFYNKRCS